MVWLKNPISRYFPFKENIGVLLDDDKASKQQESFEC